MNVSDGLLIGGAAFLLMEPVTYLVHRFVMHGPGRVWHRSHHARRAGRLERNDLYPVVFASLTVAAMAVGSQVPALVALVPVGGGITAYGIAYLLVHDGYIHRRLPGVPARLGPLERLAEAHALHHRFGGEPYGMLLPVVPARLRQRAAQRLPGLDATADEMLQRDRGIDRGADRRVRRGADRVA